MTEKNEILFENEKQANRAVARVMFTTFVIFSFIYLLNVIGIFVIKPVVMMTAYIGSAVLLLTPSVLVFGLRSEARWIKYVNITSAALFVMLTSITLTYHVVVIYVYPIAIASLYFSRRLNVYATVITAIGVTAGQLAAFVLDTPKDDNFETLYKTIVWGIIPRGISLIAVGIIFTMLCTRAVLLLSNLIHAVEKQNKYHDEMIMGFATLVENKDGSTGGHIKRTTLYVKALAEELKQRGLYDTILTKEYMENLCKAAPMHDIGKIAIPDRILQKPGKLTAEEFDMMKRHSVKGGEIIRRRLEIWKILCIRRLHTRWLITITKNGMETDIRKV